MIWLNPWAWIGLSAIAVPLLVHLLARRQARPLPFPTLRFLGVSRTVLARRDRLSDVALFVVRAGIVTAAVAALAQPHLLTRQRRETAGGALARAIIVDASASMARSSAGGNALDVARREAQRLAAEAPATSVREATSIARDVEGQAAWLSTQSGRRELIVISDFQTGTISFADLAHLPADIGVRLIPVAVAPDSRPVEVTSLSGDTETTARMTFAPAGTTVEWTSRPRATAAAGSGPALLAGDGERSRAEAARDAARAAGAPPLGADHSVAIVFPGYTERTLLIKDAAPLTEPWMFEAVAKLRRDATLQYAARTSTGPVRLPAQPFTAIANDRNGEALIAAASGRADGRSRLLLLSSADAGSLVSAALIAGVQHALSTTITTQELDPTSIPAETLRSWERAPGGVDSQPRANDRRESDGRWLWMAALALLGLETWMRRGRRSSAQPPAEVDHARVA